MADLTPDLPMYATASNKAATESVAAHNTRLGLGTGDVPEFTGLTLSGGVASKPVAFDGSKVLTTFDPMDMKNLLYGTSCEVAQEGTSFTGITTSRYTLDGWKLFISSLGTWTISQETNAPDGYAFKKSIKFLCTTANASPAAGGYALVGFQIMGRNLQHILKGTVYARKMYFSIWYKANAAKLITIHCHDVDNARHFAYQFTSVATGTWTRVNFEIPADTTGAFLDDANASLAINIWLGAGTNYTSGTNPSTWATDTSANRHAGGGNLASNTNNYIQFTAAYLHAGDIDWPYPKKTYDEELAECRIYLNVSGAYQLMGSVASSSDAVMNATNSFSMRATPSIIAPASMTNGIDRIGVGASTPTGISASNCTPQVQVAYFTGASGMTIGQTCRWTGSNILFDARL